jgi:hypothetical protein
VIIQILSKLLLKNKDMYPIKRIQLGQRRQYKLEKDKGNSFGCVVVIQVLRK